jgi:phosphoribosyl-AMP cyclohydrolase
MQLLDSIKFDANGLVAAIAQDADSGEVLMIAWMNRDTLKETLETGRMVYYSRSRKKRWLKGETSGHFQYVASAHLDCDGDAVLFKISQKGAACHENYRSCFFRTRDHDAWKITAAKMSD